MFADILKKKAFLDYENKNLRKVKKLRFFQRGWSLVSVKNLKFLLVFILVKIGQKNLIDDIIERKKPF